MKSVARLCVAIAIASYCSAELVAADSGLRLATFDVDATPPVGSMMAYDRVLRADDLPLRCRGVVLLGAGEPIVLCALDWIGVANEGHDAFRDALAKTTGTTRQRVALHTLHQHDAPDCDFLAERLLKEAGATDLGRFEGTHARQLIERVAAAVKASLDAAQPITHVGFGEAEVQEVASNRRIKGPDGKVRVTRYTATKDPAVRAEPIGTIDPRVSLVSFFSGEKPLAVLSYYACHPQSYYRMGIPNPIFPASPASSAARRCPRRCTSTSTAPAATSARASSTTAPRPTAWRWPCAWRMACSGPGRRLRRLRSPPAT